MLATQPTATKLESEIGSLNSRLGAAQSQLVTLKALVDRSAAQRVRMTGTVNGLKRRVAGLQRTVHGLQGSATVGREQQAGLRACVPQLQQELAGLTLKTSSVRGRVTRVGLSDPPLPSPACQSLFSGL
jgi:chromosome segregation ATPase